MNTIKEITAFRNQAIAEIKEFISSPSSCIKEDDFEFYRNHDGITVSPKNRNWVSIEEIELIKTFCEVTRNFRFSIYSFSTTKNNIPYQRIGFSIEVFA